MKNRRIQLWRFGTLSFLSRDGYVAVDLFVNYFNILFSWSAAKAEDDSVEIEEESTEFHYEAI